MPRGSSYIEGIARVFEARNYLAGAIAVVSTGSVLLLQIENPWYSVLIQIGSGLITGLLLYRAGFGPQVKELAEIVPREDFLRWSDADGG